MKNLIKAGLSVIFCFLLSKTSFSQSDASETYLKEDPNYKPA